MNQRMQGKRVLVTGAGTGIGRGVALEFAAEGAQVALHYSHSEPGAQEAVATIREAGGAAEAFRADFSQEEDVGRLAEEAAAVTALHWYRPPHHPGRRALFFCAALRVAAASCCLGNARHARSANRSSDVWACAAQPTGAMGYGASRAAGLENTFDFAHPY